MDETYVKLAGQWVYLYRAVDQFGQVIDVHTSTRRNSEAARRFFQRPDPSVRPVRGQHVIVENPGLDTFFIEAPVGPSWTAYFPHGGLAVLGGIAVQDDWSLEPDLEIAEQILARCVAAEPQLAGARVIGHRVGLRPARPEVRLEVQELAGTRIVHDYGHGGTGVALSWGCAREASARLTGTAP